jgi:hypothetical protein
VMVSLDQPRKIQNSTEVSGAKLRQLKIGTFVARMASPARTAGEDSDNGGGGGQHRALDLVAEAWASPTTRRCLQQQAAEDAVEIIQTPTDQLKSSRAH